VCLLALVTHAMPFPFSSPLVIDNRSADGEGEVSCSDALTQTLITIDNLNNIYLLLSTGKYLDNWGAYGSCVDSVIGGTYWMVTTSGQITNSTTDSGLKTYYTGLCVPADCNEADMISLDELFTGAAEFNNVTQNLDVSYFSVTEYVNNKQGMPGTGEVVIGLIILIFLTGLTVGSLIHFTKL